MVQSVLLYGSKTWNLIQTMLVQLEGFHIHAAYGTARKHKPCKGLFELDIPLDEGCARGMWPSPHEGLYTNTRHSTIVM